MSKQIQVDLGGSLLPLGEKKKLLNKFIAQAEESEVNNILKECESLPSIQHDLLKFLLADKFHRFDLIIELLYKGDAGKLRGAVSKRWLYEENSPLADSGFLVNKLFPNVSFNCRQKVLNRIGRYTQNEEKADRIWNAVEQRYGFHVAFPLLQACSREKINSVIADRKVNLSGYQLVQVLQKHPDIGLDYLKNNSTNFGSKPTNSYRSPLHYLYKNSPDDFLDLCINHSDKINCFKFGRNRTTKVIRGYRTKLLEHPSKFTSLLKIDRIRREFSNDEFQEFFESSLPKEPTNVESVTFWSWVNTVAKNKRLAMIDQVFLKLFQIKLDEHPEFMSPEYITLLPDEKRMSVVQWKMENDNNNWCSFRKVFMYYSNDEDRKRAFLMLKPTKQSVPELQKLLLLEQDATMRAVLSEFLIETCYINEDLPQLLNVLILLNKHSRNDQSEVRNVIFRTLNVIMGDMTFSKEHWDNIIEMIQVALVFKDNRDYSDHDKELIVEKCIAYHISSKLRVNNLVTMHIKLKIQISSTSWNNSHIKNPADRRTLLELYVKELENLQMANNLRSYNGITLESEKLSEFIANLFEEICKFNKSQFKARRSLEPILISSHKWLRAKFEELLKGGVDRLNKKSNTSSWDFAEQLGKVTQTLRKEQFISPDQFNGSQNLFSKILLNLPCNSILIHFLNTNPSDLIQNWSTTLTKMLQVDSSLEFMKQLKSWNYTTIVAESIKICTEIVRQVVQNDAEITVQQKCNAVLVLSVLSEPTDFLALTCEFYPTETKVDVFAENSEADYQIKQTFGKSLVNITVPHLTFAAIEKFCIGDYMKLVVGALYSQIGRASEIDALNFLSQKLLASPVSFQKHVIRQYLNISPVKDRIRVLKETQSSSHVSIRLEVFINANRLLRSSPSQETWTILKTIIEKTSTDDTSIVQRLHSTPKLDTCPVAYISDYIRTCLESLRRVEAGKLENFMTHIVQVVDKIPEKTLDDIIHHIDADQVSFSSSFCVSYLQSAPSATTLEHRLSNVWSLLQNIIRNGWDRKKPNMYELNRFDYPTRVLVFSFISSLCLEEMTDPTKAWVKSQIFRTLIEKYKAESVTKFFKEILYLELGLLLIKEVENSGIERLRPFGISLARYTDSLVEVYGGEIISILKDTFDDYVQVCFFDELSKNMGVIVELIDGILDTSKTRHNQIIAVNFLQKANPKANNFITTLEKINAVLKESNDVVAQMYNGLSRS